MVPDPVTVSGQVTVGGGPATAGRVTVYDDRHQIELLEQNFVGGEYDVDVTPGASYRLEFDFDGGGGSLRLPTDSIRSSRT